MQLFSKANNINLILRASICHKSKCPPRKPVKFDFENDAYSLIRMWKDPFTKNKFNENSRVIQIEGNVGAGKHEFAKKLAEELDMHIMEDVNVDDYYINEHGFDYRALNPLLPERIRNCDMEMFHENPTRHSAIHMQYYFFKLRMLQYVKAIRHLFNTGQGVILIRSVFTERVFVDAMQNMGWLPTAYTRGDGVQFYDWRDRYIFTRNTVLANVLKPHMTFYLDTPVDKCLERIRNHENPVVANSKALVPEFLQAIEDAYKDKILTSTEYYGHLYNVDHNRVKCREGVEDIIDDIAPLEFEYDHKDSRFKGWFPQNVWFWYFSTRRAYTTMDAVIHSQLLNQPWFDIAGLGDSIDHVDIALRNTLFEGHAWPVGYRYKFEQDPNVVSLREVLTGRSTFEKRLNRSFKTDFV